MANLNKTVVKSMDLLHLFRSDAILSLQEATLRSGMPKTSVHRMLKALEEMGLLEKDAQGKYRLGLLFIEFGQLVAERLDVRQAALPIMRELQQRVGEAVNLVVRDGNEAIYIEKVDTTQPVRVYTRIGRRAPLYAGACPRILLAFLSQEEQEQYLKQVSFFKIARGTLTDHNRVCSLLAEARSVGYSISFSELEDDSAAVSAPIFDHKGQVIAGLSIAGPESRFQETDLPHLISEVQKGAREISLNLGWRPQGGSFGYSL